MFLPSLFSKLQTVVKIGEGEKPFDHCCYLENYDSCSYILHTNLKSFFYIKSNINIVLFYQ
jgi:hypothetical protein